ncbi:hypothetical protein JW926_04580, partial [Candidatus Sumerlaeota bacterium]|nr:hypothetical protein [Candidatus Sumerlaeota bacterium]
MNDIFEKRKNLTSRIEILWDKTEQMILRFFESYAAGGNDPDGLPKMTDFNIITAAVKRLQEARLDLLKEEIQYESPARTDESDPEGAAREISRILEALEKNGTS